jgi:hypothetical protein
VDPGDIYGYSCEYGNYSKHRASQAGSILLAQEQLQLVAFSRPQSDRGGRAVIQSQRNQARNPIWTKHAGNFGGKLLTGAQCILGQSLSWDKRAKNPSRVAETCVVHLKKSGGIRLHISGLKIRERFEYQGMKPRSARRSRRAPFYVGER